ncbi:glycosyl transferase, partial [Parabacteroides sp. OttesenSCG-928-G07]|nr:glycosyl transferase [Parabacteroides sp. OttesenSCG-928-G07]
MKILFIIPGSGDAFYCGNCFRDNLQASALRKAGHEVVIMPLYLPLKHQSFQADTPLFFPATTYFVAQKFFGEKKMPGWLKRITGSDSMLNMASSMSGTTSAEGMEEMTISMITGDDPAFREQVQQLIDWINHQEKPDIIHLS